MFQPLIPTRAFMAMADCREAAAALPENLFDAIITDPPYHLQSMVKRFSGTTLDADTQTSARSRNRADAAARLARGFIGHTWDGGDIAFDAELWRTMYRVVKPGGWLAAFGSPRGYHRMAVAIEDAGFEIRDSLIWLYGTGFPKSHNQEGAWAGWGTALKPGYEPITWARKPLSEKTVAANLARWGTGAIHIEAARAEARFPANVCHDGNAGLENEIARFFYCAKANARDRRGSQHPTVKPVALMQWLCRLLVRPGGLVFDPFAGSGSTVEAALNEGLRIIVAEREPTYQQDIAKRILAWQNETGIKGV